MAYRRLLLSGLTLFFVILSGGAGAQSSGPGLRGLDERTQSLKEDVFALNRDLFILAEELLYPAAAQLSVFLSVDAGGLSRLDSVELEIDGEVVTNHRYSEHEVNALFQGGVHRLYIGNISMGEHELTASVATRKPSGRVYRQSASFIFFKNTDPKLIEMKVVKVRGKRQPAISLPVTPLHRQSPGFKSAHFGEALFDYYQGKNFSAISRLMIAQERQQLQQHEHEAELLLGELYLFHRLHREAGRIFARLIDQGAPPDVAARAGFYLAKNWYQRGYFRKAQDALLRIRDTLPEELQDERRVLLALALMKQNRYGEAVAVLRQFKGKSEWAAYAGYNMGVGLIQLGRQKEGVAVLEKIARMRVNKSEMKALRDKANLALGFAFLSTQEPGRATSYFREISLNGPYSNKALLGIGWALSAKGKHKQSLVPWMELQSRDDIGVAVQESLLAVPYALGQLEAYKQSLQHYENAIAVYSAEIKRLGRALQSLRAGDFLAAIVSDDLAEEAGGISTGERLPDTAENRYLIQLFASHNFHETLKNYRDLQSLSRNLNCWSYVLALAIEKDGGLHQALKGLMQETADTVGDVKVADSEGKCGSSADIRHLSIENGNVNNRSDLSRADANLQQYIADDAVEDFVKHSTPLGGRISQLQVEIEYFMRAHMRYLEELAVMELERQKQRLRSYVTQARFGIAQVYDRSSSLTEENQ